MLFWDADTYNIIVLDSLALTPSAHNKGVIESNDGDVINALGFDLLQVLGEAWHVTSMAAGREGAGHCEEHDLLVRPFLGGVVGDGHAAFGYISALGRVGDISGGVRA